MCTNRNGMPGISGRHLWTATCCAMPLRDTVVFSSARTLQTFTELVAKLKSEDSSFIISFLMATLCASAHLPPDAVKCVDASYLPVLCSGLEQACASSITQQIAACVVRYKLTGVARAVGLVGSDSLALFKKVKPSHNLSSPGAALIPMKKFYHRLARH